MKRAGDVHLASDPERLFGIEGERDHLVDVVRGRVVTGEVVHIAGIADEQDVDSGRGHAALHFGDPLQVFRSLEWQHHVLLEQNCSRHLLDAGNSPLLTRRFRPLSHDHPAAMNVTTIAAAAMALIQSPSRSESGS